MATSSQNTSFREPCDVCGSVDKQTWTCVPCGGFPFCDECWGKERPHRPGIVGSDGMPHEKTDKRIVECLKNILVANQTLAERENQHKNDQDTKWFGVARDSANTPIFQEHGRYADIMAKTKTSDTKTRYPQLVSFIGQTGAGKSTLIKMLIENQDPIYDGTSEDYIQFPSPVTGLIDDNVPTSGDVHLYSEPSTCYSNMPILYADCEGLDGGENMPRGARLQARDKATSPPAMSTGSNHDLRRTKSSLKLANSSQRNLAWATDSETQKREYAVSQLYPRLLYAFSDVVVFVLRNSKTFESIVLEKLLGWAATSIESSYNQPTLPHIIIALNTTELKIDESQWDVEEATNKLMSDIEGAIYGASKFRNYISMWQQRGKQIRTTQELLECYYKSVKVVKIPKEGRYMLMNRQLDRLNKTIQDCCKGSYDYKENIKMLANAETLEKRFQSAYDHYSNHLDIPFDFIMEAARSNHIPQDFGGNIMKLAIAMWKQEPGLSGPGIFRRLSYMVASYVMLDLARKGLRGPIVNFFEQSYGNMCWAALENFRNTFWPCCFKSEKHGRCVNVRSGHGSKGHQNSSGRIIGTSLYQSDFDEEQYYEQDWLNDICDELEIIDEEVHDKHRHRPKTELEAAWEVHEATMNEFFGRSPDALHFVSHTTCFSCLGVLPEHPLPCGHILCTSCVQTWGKSKEKTLLEVDYCPFHSSRSWDKPLQIKVKPAHAGVRVLSLDGGGIRGIIELETLKAIEIELGGKLPIQAFFDLIVGTSTGGIIALGLGVQNWTVDECIQKFKDLCKHAFAPRTLNKVPILRTIQMINHKSKYKNKKFEKCLQETFEDRPLFGGPQSQRGYMVKVAITSTTLVEQKPIILTNYNRPVTKDYNYKFERFENPCLEMKLWEVARATSAAPSYFKPFKKRETRREYVDGALYHNNPVFVAHNEHKAIWPDVGQQLPDLFLSVGTGSGIQVEHQKKTIFSKFKKTPDEFPNSIASGDPLLSNKQSGKLKTYFGQMLNTVTKKFDFILDCDQTWDAFTSEAVRFGSDRRHFRINPDLKMEVPFLDDVEQLGKVQKQACMSLNETGNKEKVVEIARRLIASTFYFEKEEGSIRENQSDVECKGFIRCRFIRGSEEMKELGILLKRYEKGDFSPHFVVQEDDRAETVQKLPISQQFISDMIDCGVFNNNNSDRIKIRVSNQSASTTISLRLHKAKNPFRPDSCLPISGFPRMLMTEDIPRRSAPVGPISHTGFKRRPNRRRRPASRLNSRGGPAGSETSFRMDKSQVNLHSESTTRTSLHERVGDVRKRAALKSGPEDTQPPPKRRRISI